MTMIRQLALWIAAVVALAIGGSAVVAGAAARQSMHVQWAARNSDAATLLALALSQQRGDLELMKLLLVAQSDAAHYRSIRLLAADGSELFARTAPPTAADAPAWLARALRLEVAPGRAIVSDGWRQIGRVEVLSDPAAAYGALWSSLVSLSGWLLLVGLGALAVAVAGVRTWQRGLSDVVAQAQDLEQGRFGIIAEPRTFELRRLAAGMNAMVRRVRAMFETQATQLEALRRQAHTDTLTGLSNRLDFSARMERALVGPMGAAAAADGPRRGALMIVRVRALEAMNSRVGREAADRVLGSIAALLQAYPERVEGAFAGRLNGSDLALYLPVSGVAAETMHALEASLRAGVLAIDPGASVAIGAVDGLPTGGVSDAFAAADEALACAEAAGASGVQTAIVDAGTGQVCGRAAGESDWRERISEALAAGRVQLQEYPVVDRLGRVVHLECPLRVQFAAGGPFDNAARWLPMATRSRLVQQADLAAAGLALRAIGADDQARSVHVSAESLAEPGFMQEVARLLAAAPGAARRLSIEVSEAGIVRVDRLGQAVAAWSPFGVRLGLENAGRSLHLLMEARSRGIDYLKVDGRFLRGIAREPRLAEYARQVLATAAHIGLVVYAEGVDEAADLECLWDLGFAGATGPAATAAR